jgi:voltage-gated potassium channel
MNEQAARMERRLEIPLLIAALLTIPAIALDQSRPNTTLGVIATALNWGIWLAFLGEVALMLSVVDNRMRWARDHPLDVAIVLLTPPFLPASLQAARAFRLLRVLRLLRAAALLRRLLTTEGVRDAAVLALLTILGGGAGFAAVEKVDQHGHHLNAWDGVWWAITTVTTVGYGDLSPSTTGGRVIAIVVMLVGIGFVAILTAAAAERFIRSRERSERERAELFARLDDIVARLEAAERRGH